MSRIIYSVKGLCFLLLCFFSTLTWATTENNNDGGTCAVNVANCTADLAKFNGKFFLFRFIKASLHPLPNEKGSYQLSLFSVPSFLHYICCDPNTKKQFEKSVSVNDMIRLWKTNAKQKFFITQLWPIEKLFHFILIVKNANYDTQNQVLTLTIQPGKDSAAIAPNFTDSLNTLSTFFFYNKGAYQKYNR
jgi:hypothetical protein